MELFPKLCILMKKSDGIGSVKGRKLLTSGTFTDMKDFFDKMKGSAGKRDYKSIEEAYENTDFDELEEYFDREKIIPVTFKDREYPKGLEVLQYPPLMLFCKGDVSLLKRRSLGVVGTRDCTAYGEKAARKFVTSLAEDFCIVSGMAKGIDSAAHRAALNANGKTVAVLGSGVDIVYPAENRELYNAIVEKGLVVSEYLPGMAPDARHFPERNRIISGLSEGVLVVEATEKSGSILTLNAAIEQNKTTFCIPGNIFASASLACNKAIRNGRAKIAICPDDVRLGLGMLLTGEKDDLAVGKKPKLNERESAVFDLLANAGEAHFEEILSKTGISVPELNALLIGMAARGLIVKSKNNFWSLK